MQTSPRAAARAARSRSGQAIAELAIVAPVFVLLLLGAWQFAKTYMAVEAVQVAARNNALMQACRQPTGMGLSAAQREAFLQAAHFSKLPMAIGNLQVGSADTSALTVGSCGGASGHFTDAIQAYHMAVSPGAQGQEVLADGSGEVTVQFDSEPFLRNVMGESVTVKARAFVSVDSWACPTEEMWHTMEQVLSGQSGQGIPACDGQH